VWISRALQERVDDVGGHPARHGSDENADASDPTAVGSAHRHRIAAHTLISAWRSIRKFKPCLRIVLTATTPTPDHAGSRFRRAVPPRQRDRTWTDPQFQFGRLCRDGHRTGFGSPNALCRDRLRGGIPGLGSHIGDGAPGLPFVAVYAFRSTARRRGPYSAPTPPHLRLGTVVG